MKKIDIFLILMLYDNKVLSLLNRLLTLYVEMVPCQTLESSLKNQAGPPDPVFSFLCL